MRQTTNFHVFVVYCIFVIETTHLTKRYGDKLAVDDLTIRVEPGRVTGFLGPNGAGKSTTMRLIMGLDHPTSGSAVVNGLPYSHLKSPLHEVGALLDAKAANPGRSARNHLRIMAATQGIPAKRADELLEMTGLTSVANKSVGTFSLGMGQRLGIATALLGDPQTLILDEPVNGLDTEGILWVRNLVKQQAADGKTVFLSSHLMSEMEMVADHLVILGRGRLLAEKPMSEFITEFSGVSTRVASPQATAIADAAQQAGFTVKPAEPGVLLIGAPADQLGQMAASHGWVLHELTPQHLTLEDAYMKLTESAVEYKPASPKEVAA